MIPQRSEVAWSPAGELEISRPLALLSVRPRNPFNLTAELIRFLGSKQDTEP